MSGLLLTGEGSGLFEELSEIVSGLLVGGGAEQSLSLRARTRLSPVEALLRELL